jgi:hypothetical protein
MMLTADLLLTRSKGPYITPCYIDVNAPAYITLAEGLITLFAEHKGRSRREFVHTLDQYIGTGTDYRLQRGLAKLLEDDWATFAIESVADPAEIRRQVFALARENHPVVRHPDLIYPVTKHDIFAQVAHQLHTTPEQVQAGLYADLVENHRLVRFDPPGAIELLQRYNVALAQAMLYRCNEMRLIVYRNLPVRYKQLFKFIKFFRLIHSITGDLDAGYEVILDGPASMFRLSQKYGLRMAIFLPALLLCTRWKMQAEIIRPDGKRQYFHLDEKTGLVSHYRDTTVYDSLLEETFAERFEQTSTTWRLERETEIINLKDTVFIPDFAFRHPDGRTALLEIIGFWRPEYLRRKLEKLRRASRQDMIIAVSADLNVSEADFDHIPGHVFFFKTRINPQDVMERLEQLHLAYSRPP